MSLYQSEAWKSIPAGDRLDLLLVMEGLKPGCSADFDVSDLSELIYVPCYERKKANGEIEYCFTSNDKMNHLKERMLKNPELKIRNYGDFYGYPECCVSLFEKEEHPGVRFNSQVSEMIKWGYYPDLFEYNFFIPCGPYCKDAIMTYTTWARACNKLDPEAVIEVRDYNRTKMLSDFKTLQHVSLFPAVSLLSSL